MEYRGYGNTVNAKPEGEWIKVFVSDWNKDYWAFYAYIALDNYKQDISEINELMHKLLRDGDIYVELIAHSSELSEFYGWLLRRCNYTNMAVLNPENWRNAKTFIATAPTVR